MNKLTQPLVASVLLGVLISLAITTCGLIERASSVTLKAHPMEDKVSLGVQFTWQASDHADCTRVAAWISKMRPHPSIAAAGRPRTPTKTRALIQQSSKFMANMLLRESE